MTRTPLSRKVAGAFVALATILVCATQSFAGPSIEPRFIYKSMIASEVFVADLAIKDRDTGKVRLPSLVTTYVNSSPGGVKLYSLCSGDGWDVVSTGGSNVQVLVNNPISVMTTATSFVPKCGSFVVANTVAGTMYLTIIAEYD